MENTENNGMKDLMTNVWCVVVSVLKKWKFIFCVALLCGMVTDVARTLLYTPQYSSSTQAVVQTEQNTYEDLGGTRTYIKTLQYILNGQVARSYVQDTLQKPDLPMQCQVISQNDTNIVTISMISDSRQNSYYALQTLLDWYQEKSESFDPQYALKIRSHVRFAPEPLAVNQHSRNFAKGAIAGGMLIVAILVLMEFLKKTIRAPEDVERYISCRLFAKIPKETKPRGKIFWKRSKQAILISSVKTSLPYREAIRKLRYKLETSAQRHGYQTVLVTSASENEGKSSVSANLAISMGMKKYKVLLLDCDLLKPAVHKTFGKGNERQNINCYLRGKDDWKSQMQFLPKQNIYIVTAKPENSTEFLLSNGRLEQMLKEAKEEFDFIILDSPPAGAVNDAIRLNTMVDASLLVVRQDSASCGLINETVSRMSNARNNLVGCIYNARYGNRFRTQKSDGYDRSYNYRRGG